MLSQTVEYALRAAVFLAENPGEAHTVKAVAAATQVPAAYLAKVTRALQRADLIHAQRGAGGGLRLADSPENVSILQIVNAVDPVQRITTCPLGLKAHAKKLCPLHSRLDAALASVETAFAGTTLAEVLADPSTSRPLKDFPCTFPSQTS